MKQEAVIIDLDGTLSNNPHRANKTMKTHKDFWPLYKYIPEDIPQKWCVKLVDMAELYGCKIIFLTGRPEQFQLATMEWLNKHLTLLPLDYKLIMMPDDWPEEDNDFKAREIEKLIKEYDILFAVDDRMSNVNEFKKAGIMCLYCGGETE